MDFPVGTDFWKGSKFIREGELHALTDDEAEKAGSIVSTFAETVDEATEMTPRPASLGCHLRQKFKQVVLLLIVERPLLISIVCKFPNQALCFNAPSRVTITG